MFLKVALLGIPIFFFNRSSSFFKGVLKILENVQEKFCYAVLYSKLQAFKLWSPALPSMFLKL